MRIGISTAITDNNGPNYIAAVGLDPDQVIRDLFGPTDVGAWYDPSDSTTVFQDAAGTTPAAVGDPVGLILDKSQGLGETPELVVNGTFDSTSNWIVSPEFPNSDIDISGGTLTCTRNPSGYSEARSDAIALEIGKRYIARVNVIAANDSYYLMLSSSPTDDSPGRVGLAPTSGVGPKTFSFVATYATAYFYIASNNGAGDFVEVDDVSLQLSPAELPGNHATQSTSAARPIRQQTGGLYYLDFDGVDDTLAVTFASAQPQPNTICMGWKYDNYTSSAYDFVYDSPGSARHVLWDQNNITFAFAQANLASFLSDTNDSVTTMLYNGASSVTRRNGTQQTTGNVGALNWGGIKLSGMSGLNLYNFNGRMYGYVGISRDLDAGEIDTVEAYLAEKSGVTL